MNKNGVGTEAMKCMQSERDGGTTFSRGVELAVCQVPFPLLSLPLFFAPFLPCPSFPSPPFPLEVSPLKFNYVGSAVSSPVGSRAEPQPKSNLVHFRFKVWHLAATMLMIFPRINLPKFVQIYFCYWSEKNSSIIIFILGVSDIPSKPFIILGVSIASRPCSQTSHTEWCCHQGNGAATEAGVERWIVALSRQRQVITTTSWLISNLFHLPSPSDPPTISDDIIIPT